MANQWIITDSVDLSERATVSDKIKQAILVPGDAAGHVWNISVYNNGESVDLTGNGVTAYFARTNNDTVVQSGTVSGNVATIVFPQPVYAYAGLLRVVVRLSYSSTITTLAEAIFRVSDQMPGTTVDGGNVVPSLEELMSQISTLETLTTQAQGVVNSSVRYDTAQSLTDAQKLQAKVNIGSNMIEAVANNDHSGIVSSYIVNSLPCIIRNTNVWYDATATHYMIPVAPGDSIIIRAKLEQVAHYAILRSFDPANVGQTPDFSTASGFTARVQIAKDTTASFTAPFDAAYLCLNGLYSTYDYTPESVLVNGVEMLSGVRSHIANLQNRQSIYQSLALKVVKTISAYYDEAGRKYQAQTLAVTDDYVVIGMNSVNTTQFPSAYDKYNAFLALDKTTLEPASITPNPVIIDFENGGYVIAASHAGAMTYVASSNELWVRTTTSVVSTNKYAIVLDADTLALKNFVQMPYSGTFGYDNDYGKWCFMQDLSTDSNMYYIRIFESTRTSQIGAVKAWKQGTTQSCEFYDNAIFIPNTWATSGNNHGSNLMMIDATTGLVLGDWWFEGSHEFEDLDFVDDQILLLTAESNAFHLQIGAFRPYNRNPANMLTYMYPWNSTITTE